MSQSRADIIAQHPRAGQRWSHEEDDTLRQRFAQGATITQLSAQLERQPSAIEARLAKLGLIESKYPAPPPKPAPYPLVDCGDRHKVPIVAQRYLEVYEQTFGRPNWPVRQLLRDMAQFRQPNPRLANQFLRLVHFLESKSCTIGWNHHPWQGYIKFGVRSFFLQQEEPFPDRLRNPVLFLRYLAGE